MTDDDGEDAAAAAGAEVRRLAAAILGQLRASLATLDEGGGTVADAQRRHELLRQHVKQLQAVFDIEGCLEGHGRTEGVGVLDLDAARREIRERLLRIRAAGGGGDLPPGPE